MAESKTQAEVSMAEIKEALDLLFARMASMDTTQQQMRVQMDLQAAAVQDLSSKRDDDARRTEALTKQLDATAQAVLHMQDAPPARTQHNLTRGVLPDFSEGAAGHGLASPTAPASYLLNGRQGGEGSSGGPHSGIRPGRPAENPADGSRPPLPKMSFPRFNGEQPRIWRDKCMDYFRIFNIHPSLWVTSASIHMEGNAALWLYAYKLRHQLQDWLPFIKAVEEKFGASDHRMFVNDMLQLEQKGTVQEYKAKFDELAYQVCMHNPHYDQTLLVSQFVKGLKHELRGTVESQLPDTVDRAALLAQVYQEVLARSKSGATWHHEPDSHPQRLKQGQADFWKDRQLRDYRRVNGLCYHCGDKYDPTHQCARKGAAELHALTMEDRSVILSDEVLNLLEIADATAAEQYHLSS